MGLLSETAEGSGGFVEKPSRSIRSGKRVWSETVKGRAVFESMQPGARVSEVAQRYGVKAQQLTVWRRLARDGKLAVVADKDEATGFVPIEVSTAVASKGGEAPVEISIGKVTVRLDAASAAVRIAEIAAALERGA
jgi:transposase